MASEKTCTNCETKLAPIKGGYSCPNCHTLYTREMEMIWDATKKHRNPGAATMH